MVEVAMLKCVTILNIWLLAVGTDAFDQDQSLPSDVPKNSRIWEYMVMDVRTLSCLEWSDSCVTCRSDQPESLANPRMFNVCDGAKSRQNPNSALFYRHKPTPRAP